MAIQNASDLLVYKNVASSTQITRIIFGGTPTSGTLGNLVIKNTTDGSGVVADVTTGNVSSHSSLQASTVCRAALQTKGYTVTAPSAFNSNLGASYYIDCTNGQAGDVATISIESGTATLDQSLVIVVVRTSGATAGYEPVAFSTSASFSINNELRDTTNKDSSGWSQSQSGLKNFEISTEALQDFTADLDFQEMFNDIGSTTAVTVRFAQRDTGGSSDKYYQGSAFISSLSMDSGVEENATYSVTFTGTASVTEGTD